MYSRVDRNGEWFQLYQIGFDGIPGRPFGDRPDGHSLWPSFTNVPNEFLESYFPLVIERYQTVADSGGPGFFQGGNGIDITYRFWSRARCRSTTTAGSPTRSGPRRRPARRPVASCCAAPTAPSRCCPLKCDHVKVGVGDTLQYLTWGGGGWGGPFDRDPALVALEVDRGLVSRAGALRYGVVLTDAGAADEEATKTARERLRASGATPGCSTSGPTLDALERLRGRDRPAGAPAPVFR